MTLPFKILSRNIQIGFEMVNLIAMARPVVVSRSHKLELVGDDFKIKAFNIFFIEVLASADAPLDINFLALREVLLGDLRHLPKRTTRCHVVVSMTLPSRFLIRSFVAMFKLATGVPACVYLISGSWPRLPSKITLFTVPMTESSSKTHYYLILGVDITEVKAGGIP